MTPSETAQHLVATFDRLSEYPVQCALQAVSAFLTVHTNDNWKCAHWKFWNDVKIELEQL